MRIGLAVLMLGLSAAWSLVSPASAVAQSADAPAAMVSIAPMERLMQDFSYLMRSCGVPQIGGLGSMMAKQYTQGLDASRPAGVMVRLVDSQPVVLAFLPLNNRQQFFSSLAGASLIPDDLGNGMFAFDANGQTIFAKDAGKWLFISQQEDDLGKLPADPQALLGDMPARYDIALNINLQALPKEMRDMAVGQLRTGFERSLAEQTNQSAEERAQAEEVGRMSIQQLERIFSETEKVVIGWNSAASTQKVQLDVGAQFVEGSEMAKQMTSLQSMTSDYTGLLIDGAAMTMRTTSMISESDKAMSKNNLRNAFGLVEKQIDDSDSLPTSAKESLKKFIKGFMSIVDKTIDGGKLDGGGAVSLNDGKVRAVFGGMLADGARIEKEIKDLVAQVGSGGELPSFEFNYAKHQDVNLHKVTIPIQSDEPAVQRIFGNQIKLVVGTGEKSFFVSIDPDGDGVIKAALDRIHAAQNVKVIPGEVVLEAAQILSFAQSLVPNPMLDTVTQTVLQAEGKSKVRVLNSMIPRGMMYQISIDEGVLKGIGAGVQAGQGGGAGF